jgi:signal transduction histidine kinase
MTVRLRITVVAVLLAALAMVLAAVALVTTLRSSLVSSADDASRSRAQGLVTSASAGPLANPITGIGDDGVAQVVGDDGRVLAATSNVTGHPRISTYVPKGKAADLLVVRGAPDDNEREDYRVWALRGNGVTVYVGNSLESVRQVVFRLTRSLLVGIPLLLVLFGGGTWLLVGRTLRPVEDIRTEVAAISHRRLDRRVPVPPYHDEVGRLARTMNDMLARLEKAADQQRDFVANASHELQSPLAAFRAQLEVAQAHPEGLDLQTLGADLLEDADRMEALVHDLLFLARDEGTVPPAAVPVDLDDVVLEETSRLRAARPLSVHTDAVSAAPVLGRRDDLGRLVRNLLDNATDYARSRVDVSLGVQDGQVELMVSDDGPGIAEDDRPHVFERFYRADAARDRQSGGTGLGLAIAASVAHAHGGAIDLVDGTPGARFVVRLPVFSPETPGRR